MWNLDEYRKHPQRLADHLPWATLIAPGVMLNKDGSLQKTIVFRGPDLDSSTPYELVAARARMNNVLRRLGSHWCVHVEASRRLAHVYPATDFPNPVAAMIDQERRDSFTADALHYESQCFITFTYLPPAEGMTRLGDFFIDRPNNKVDGRVSYRAHFDHFIGQVDQIVNLMASFMPEVHPLDDSETLTYLHSCISDRRLNVAVPDVPFYLDEMITDRALAGGLSPRLGRLFLKTVSVRAYVNRTLPCLLDRLNELPIEYRWIGRYLPMDKTDATRQLNKLRRQWFAKRKGMVTLLKEAITKQESKLEDSDSLNKSEDVDAALQELGGDHCSFGDFTLTITVWDEDEQTATEKARAVQQVVDGVGLVTEIEDFNAVQAWMGSLPGHAYADVRRPLVSSLNVCDLVPLSAVWSGPARCAHLDGPPLLVTRTKGSTPFRMSLHQGDVGHTIIAGPTGAGKSTLLNLIACQWLRYPSARVYIFDKGASCRAMTLAMGGDFYDLGGEGEEICFQPFAGIEDESELAWAQDWIADLLHREKAEITPATKQELWAALSNLASMPRVQRTLSTLLGLVQDADVRQAMRSYTLDGPHGRLLDANHDTLGDGDVELGARWQAFEMEHLMHSRSALLPVLTYLFRRLEKRFDGSPTLMILDEAWLYLTESLFAAKIREWLKVLRKKNVAVTWRLRFVPLRNHPRQEKPQRSERRSLTPIEVVSLFSGGLDSMCGAAYAAKQKSRVVFVTHSPPGRDATEDFVGQIYASLGREKPRKDNFAAYRLETREASGRERHALFPEHSRRSRPFFFLCLAAATAIRLGASRIWMNENGALALSLPIRADTHGPSMARQAHSFMLNGFTEMFRRLKPRESPAPEFDNPFVNFTKGEVCEELGEAGKFVSRAMSCEYTGRQRALILGWLKSHPRRRHEFGSGPQCGICVPCLVRRAALRHAKIGDPDSLYFASARRLVSLVEKRGNVVDIFGADNAPPMLNIPASNVIHLPRFCETLRTMNSREFAVRYLPELRTCRDIPSAPSPSPAQAFSLMRRFADEVLGFIHGS